VYWHINAWWCLCSLQASGFRLGILHVYWWRLTFLAFILVTWIRTSLWIALLMDLPFSYKSRELLTLEGISASRVALTGAAAKMCSARGFLCYSTFTCSMSSYLVTVFFSSHIWDHIEEYLQPSCTPRLCIRKQGTCVLKVFYSCLVFERCYVRS